MCNKITDVYAAVLRPIFRSCFVEGEIPVIHDLLNAKSTGGSISQCAFSCNNDERCLGFSYDTYLQNCQHKSAFPLADIVYQSGSERMISGPKKLCGESYYRIIPKIRRSHF